MIENWCYVMCDSVVLPLVAIITAVWTFYQEIRHQKGKYAAKK